MTKYYFESLTDWISTDGSENKKVLWFKYTHGKGKKLQLDFKFFDNCNDALKYCKDLKMIM